MTYAGPLPSIDAGNDLALASGTPVAVGRASVAVSSAVVPGSSQRLDPNGDSAGASGLSYLASGEGTTRVAEPTAFLGIDERNDDEVSTEPVLATSIAAGGVPLRVLLSGPVVPSETEAGGLEQVAELIPSPESSLALAAALWTVSAGSQTPQPRSDLSSGGAMDSAPPSVSTPPWLAFLTGREQAFEQSLRDLKDDNSSPDEARPENAGALGGSDELLQWQRPILPAATGSVPVVKTGSAPNRRNAALNDDFESVGVVAEQATRTGLPPDSSSPSEEFAGDQKHDARAGVLGATSKLSLVSFSTLAVGWFLSRRKRERRLRVRRSDLTMR
jgi:hypothetical protein